MPSLNYRIGYIALSPVLDEIFKKISCRTEVRRAQKEGVVVRVFHHEERSSEVLESCRAMLAPLLRSEKVPYDSSFDRLIAGPLNYLFVAYTKEGIPSSFISVEETALSEAFAGKKAAYLSLSATNSAYKALCPNYLLIWRAIEVLKEAGFDYFNLGLLFYEKCPDPDLERVAFFKRKWYSDEYVQHERVSFFVYVYYRFFKRYRWCKSLILGARQFIKRCISR